MCTPTPAIFTSRPILSLHAPLPNFPSAGSRHRRAGGARAPFLRSPGPIRNGSLLMQTAFSPEQLADPAMASSEAVIRKCVHCGFCTATCPTYVLLGDELDSPRGRIYLITDMLENERDPTPEMVKQIARCLSCLLCITTFPSGECGRASWREKGG